MPPDDSRPIRSVAIYTRVSTRHQAKEGHSLETQEADLVALAERNGWDYEVYSEPGRSGETLDGRPALTRLLEDVAQGRVDAVLVIDESRLARDNLVAALIRKVLRDADVMIQTPHGPRDLTEPEPELLSMITAAVAHFEQRQRTAKMKRGQRAAAERGMWLGGPPPFGYRADREGRGTVLRVDPEERVVVERAVHLVVDLGLSTWEAARRLNLEGLGPRRADRWRHQNLRRTLSSDALRGHVVWGRGKQQPYVLPVEPVLPARRFQALQAALAASALPRRRDAHLYPLTGFMQGACGARYYGTYRADRGGGIRQYRCHGNHVYADSRCADRWRPHANALETAVWEEIGRVLTHENLVRLADAWLAREQLRQQPLIEQLQEEVLRLEVVVASTAVDLVRAGMDPAAAARAVGHLNEDLLSKRRRLDGAQGTRTDAPGDDLRAEALALQAADRLETLSYEDQRRLLALLGVELRVEQEGGRARPGLVRLRGGLPAMLLRSWVHPRHDASASRPDRYQP